MTAQSAPLNSAGDRSAAPAGGSRRRPRQPAARGDDAAPRRPGARRRRAPAVLADRVRDAARRAEVAWASRSRRRRATRSRRCWRAPSSSPSRSRRCRPTPTRPRRLATRAGRDASPTSSRTGSRRAARTTTSCSSTWARRATSRPSRLRLRRADHLDAGRGLRAIDTERGAKVSGARFYYLTGIGARLELALLNAAVDKALTRASRPSSRRRWSSPRSWRAPASSARTPTRSTTSRPTTCTSSAPARSRSPATTRARSSTCRTARSGTRLVGLLPARGRLVRQGHPRDHPRAPVPQGRGVQLDDDRGRRRRAPPHPRVGGGDAGARASCPTA